MGWSSYPNGWAGGVLVKDMPINSLHPGKIFWVNNSGVLPGGGIGGSDGNPGTYLKPFSTIDYAIGKCKANRGDIIAVAAGHAENLASDGAIACDVAGVAIVGLGSGTKRPTLSFITSAAAAMTVSADNVTLHNILFNANVADVTNAIDVTAANLTVSRCEFKEAGADLNFVDYIHASSTTDNTADGITVVDSVGTAVDAAQNSFVMTAADIDRPWFEGNFYSSDHANTLAFYKVTDGKTTTDVMIKKNYMYTGATGDVGGIADGNQTDNTGMVIGNRLGHHDTSGEVLCDLDGVRQFDNLGTATDTASGYVLPAIDS
tara:strand:- start:57 stop:1010 length:954 start_codon:yes stop_codon:yes gene_type:complete